MIEPSPHFDLGLDTTRIKDKRDAERQTATVREVLSRLYNPDLGKRWELQLVADEVGMGKTFVALGVAYSLLHHMREKGPGDDLRYCYGKVLVIAPGNVSLYEKWYREVKEFARRCVRPEHRAEAESWFAPVKVERFDELALAFANAAGPRVLVAHTGILGNRKLQHYDLKRRFLLGTLFRYWANRFRVDQRERLLKGAPDGWGNDPYALNTGTDEELALLPYSEEQVLRALERLDRPDEKGNPSDVEKLLELCREIATPYMRNRSVLFGMVEPRLVALHKEIAASAIRQSLPLVIVDEAHNWKNGPSAGSNGYHVFREYLAPWTRRVLLLTATPFQLAPKEMLELIRIGEDIQPAATKAESQERVAALRERREAVLTPVLENAAKASVRFAKAWARLPPTVSTRELADLWFSDSMKQTRQELRGIANLSGVVDRVILDRVIDNAVARIDPNIRELLREGLRLFTFNSDLSQELGEFVIRHRRQTDHRLFRVGGEYQRPAELVAQRPDSHVLHAAAGVDVRGDGELPHYLLMRCVSEMKHGKGRSSLGSALTGCYSTLHDSAEGRGIKHALDEGSMGQVYLDVLLEMVDESQDPRHPKVREVVDAVMKAWQGGEKSLVFCFRTNTAERLRSIIDDRIRDALDERRACCLGGGENLKTLRSRLTGRDRDLIVLGLDRVLWSLHWTIRADGREPSFSPDELRLGDEELVSLVDLARRFGVDLLSERVDRVFLQRAVEHVIACRLCTRRGLSPLEREVLEDVADPAWVARPYGLHADTQEDTEGEDPPEFDERGVHTVYEEVPDYESDPRENERRASELAERRARARRSGQIPIVDVYAEGPSLWLGMTPPEEARRGPAPEGTTAMSVLLQMHHHIWGLTREKEELDWRSRLLVFQAMRRALLRESVLLRLLPKRTDLAEESWGDLLARAFFDRLPGQRESMADRIAVFLEDLQSASGSFGDSSSQRFVFYDATRLRDQNFVALVSGNTKASVRERIFAGFNTPLLPEVLVCTAVGQEGIDLHRHCRHVVHYDLAWNPAVLEQRTGRADRIGSKTFRERARSRDDAKPYLEIGVPFLAGTYDERMYEELRLRAQTFEVLTGGDLAADHAEGEDHVEGAEDKERGLHFVPLPGEMVHDLRVKLHVWSTHE